MFLKVLINIYFHFFVMCKKWKIKKKWYCENYIRWYIQNHAFENEYEI